MKSDDLIAAIELFKARLGTKKTLDSGEPEMPKKDTEEIFSCSFCNKSQREVKKLIAGPTVFICDECVDICLDIIAEDRIIERMNTMNTTPSIQSLQIALDRHLEGQAAAKLTLATIFHNHHARVILADQSMGKANALLAGPTGSGKSLAVETLAREIALPFAVIHATRLSGLSYFKDVNVLQVLHDQTGGDARKAGKGVICIEQVDRIASREGSNELGLRVQETLLHTLDGGKVEVGLGREKVMIDTTNILFVACGSFPGLDRALGNEDLVRFGFLPEFAARFPVCIEFEALGERELAAILTKPGGLLEEYRKLFEMDGLKLSFSQEAIQAIAREAAKRQGGARSLRSLLESVALELSAETLTRPDLQEYVVDETFVRDRIRSVATRWPGRGDGP